MAKYDGDYYLGLDMGTGSVGWAVTDTSYRILRAKGKDMWGSRMFNEANTAVERRTNRISRRRREREKARINMLRELFEQEIHKVDPGFYHRLDESKYWLEDRTEDNAGQKYAIFAKGTMGKPDYTDKDYYAQYPTIFHLRSELAHSTETHDVRMVFLALLNMFKHRGHFLNDTLSSDSGLDFNDAWKEFIDAYDRIIVGNETELESAESVYSMVDSNALKKTVMQKGISKSQIRENCASLLHITKRNKKEYQILSLICGLAGNMNEVFGEDAFSDAEEKGKHVLNFRKSTYEEDIASLQEVLDEEAMELLLAAKEVHDVLLLDQIMQGYQFLCDARIDSYEQHKADLNLLKATVKRLAPKEYGRLFRKMDDGSYSAYVGSTNCDKNGGIIRRYVADHSAAARNKDSELLYKTIKSILQPFSNDPEVQEIFSRIDTETFLQKQLTSANGVIPNQVHAREMKAILRNAEQYLPFLLEKDENGLTVSDRIIKLFQFRMPYYVGPVGGLPSESGNKWAVRVSSDRIMPWNLERVIDSNKTRQAFIENLIRHCTYLQDEKVLPKRSLIYEKFMVLNELNNLKIAGEPITVELKQDIYNSLFMKGKPVTMKKLTDFLVVRGKIKKGEGDLISGIDGSFHNSLTSIGKFNGVFPSPYLDREHIHMIEDIILMGTIYGESKRMYRDMITEKYGENSSASCILTDKQIQKIVGFKFRDWGRVSRAFLELKGASKEDGVARTIIEALWDTNDNMMKLMSAEKYTYAEEISDLVKRTEKSFSEWTIDDLDEMYLSAPVKRMVWQTLRILQEIEEIMGKPPKRVFVEMTRENREKGKRTKSRKSQLIELYSNPEFKKEQRDWLSELNGHGEQEFRIKKLYLYYCQMGRCMYTGDPIDLDQLMDDNIYDIDHIYPRHFVKDDSIENNLVLVKKVKNAHKSDVFPIEADIQQNCAGLWRDLYKKKLICKEKYDRLTRRTDFSIDERIGFVQRQLVETGQGTKAITQILKEALPETSDVIFSKAGVVSQFRQKYGIVKCRSINDFHHAQDAYLNIVAGNVYFTKFTKNPAIFIKEAVSRPSDPRYQYHLSRMFDFTVQRAGETAWLFEKNGKENTIDIVKAQVTKNTPLITRRSYVSTGAITSKDTVWGRQKTIGSKKGAYFPQKTSDERLADVSKYGGKSGISTAAYTLISYKEGKKEVRSLEPIPSFLMKTENMDQKALDQLLDYLKNNICSSAKNVCTDFRIVYPVIKFNSLLRIDGYYYYIAGKTNDSYYIYNAVPLKMTVNEMLYAKKVEKGLDMGFFEETDSSGNLIISHENNMKFFQSIVERLQTGIFLNRKGGLLSSINSGKEQFDTLTIAEQCKVLHQIISFFSASTQNIDLSLLGQSAHAGTVTISKRIDKLNECVLVNKSVTGLYENEVDLLRV